MTINWRELQDELYELSVEALKAFALVHQDKVFYGFAFDCNADDGAIAMHPEDLEGVLGDARTR